METDREAIVRTLSELVAAADAKQPDGVLAHVELPESAPPGAWSARQFADAVRFGLPYTAACRLAKPDVEPAGDTAVGDLRVTVHMAGGGLVVITANLKWARRGKEWKIVEITGVRRGAGTVEDPIVSPDRYRVF